MDEGEYRRLADEALRRIEEKLEAAGGGFDYELAEGGVLEIECEDGSKIVINRQSSAQEIWVAARHGGFHYRWDGTRWCDTRTGEELFAALGRLLSEQSGASIRLD